MGLGVIVISQEKKGQDFEDSFKIDLILGIFGQIWRKPIGSNPPRSC